MTRQETSRVIAMCALLDDRFADASPALIVAWQHELQDVSADDALKTVARHYANSTERITPARIRNGGSL